MEISVTNGPGNLVGRLALSAVSAKMFSMVRRAAELTEIVDECDWFVSVLTAVRATGLPSAWTAAGVLRELLPDIVWEATNQAAVHTGYSEFLRRAAGRAAAVNRGGRGGMPVDKGAVVGAVPWIGCAKLSAGGLMLLGWPSARPVAA